jgi:hypothetical protein
MSACWEASVSETVCAVGRQGEDDMSVVGMLLVQQERRHTVGAGGCWEKTGATVAVAGIPPMAPITGSSLGRVESNRIESQNKNNRKAPEVSPLCDSPLCWCSCLLVCTRSSVGCWLLSSKAPLCFLAGMSRRACWCCRGGVCFGFQWGDLLRGMLGV